MGTDEQPPTAKAPAPSTYPALPGRTRDRSATFDESLTALLRLLRTSSRTTDGDEPSRASWRHGARAAVAGAVGTAAPEPELFDALLRAAVHDPDPSLDRRLVAPAVDTFGGRRVMSALIELVRSGTPDERAGAARAVYWAVIESDDRGQDVSDLRREWQEVALAVFVAEEDLDVRRCILPGLDLRVDRAPERLRGMVVEAVRIARSHPDEYLRHRVENQV